MFIVKNLLVAWNWGIESVDEFPQIFSPLELIKPFPATSNDRFVPPEVDVIKVFQQPTGQDLVMLLIYYYPGARKGVVFRLS